MRRVWTLSDIQRYRNITRCHLTPYEFRAKSSIPIQFLRLYATRVLPSDDTQPMFGGMVSLFADKWSYETAQTVAHKEFREKITELKDELLGQFGDVDKIEKVLKNNGVALFRRYDPGSVMLELLMELKHFPRLAMEVFNWRRDQACLSSPMTSEEYVKAINVAGKLKKVDLAVELFREASKKQLKTTSLFNSLMSVYMYNDLANECRELFRDLKMEPTCAPSIVTYNILISVHGRLVMVDHMETMLREVIELNLTPTLNTYKGLIAGYLTAWKWEKMEKTFLLMQAGPVKPDIEIHLLMLRGYAHSGELEKMEEIYEMVRDHVNRKEFAIIRAMISAYCKTTNPCAAKVEKIRELLKLIPANEYTPWLNVTLIRLYANENLLEEMENSINEAFEHKACVTRVGVINCIISSYFRHNAVDKLADFMHRAQLADWRSCRSIYHCKMVMYASQMRLAEMERVIVEMERVNMPLSKKSYWILYKAYEKWGIRRKLEKVVGLMWKHGYAVSVDIYSL